MRTRVFVALFAAAPTLMAASQPVRLQPSSGWVVDYAEDSCRLIRTFGEGSQQVKLAFESEAPREVDMLAVGKPLINDNQYVGARFLPMQSKPWDGQTAKTASSGDPAILWSQVPFVSDAFIAEHRKDGDKPKVGDSTRPPARDLAREAIWDAQRLETAKAITGLEILTQHGRSVLLETGSLGAAIAVFDKCSRDSLADWGVDPSLEDKIVRPVWARNVREWLNSSDYPLAMLNADEQSEVKVRVLVDASGKVTKCTSLSHFRAPEFNEITCRNIRLRARFEPAELADGTKVPSYYTKRINFRIAN